ncbi:pyridoxal-phosphate dependent enzyme [Rhizobium johnstonii]|uniref:pyridoxal-phosphate dependent enzyme n=1 Tax=Rhizobium leguminosarum TaxID=384 RepID=UPI0013C118E8|nr:pyridoxal-phosphate dependent enzyme [Rhizobium leguminosarum]WSG95786.1 pyridoxal-phosphate dependent enzyme [Rhizobium johnstonii]NEH99227.1 pyridoxal-phosphate dependent enzyme [Rhizobium leguminosarum]NEJ42311.1 pyridoxal-phosphate dependent enzyme [Rhizobium leguminosarum]NEJ48880.1 pyridoxal-phosphate dependent enzyme [Rhizobium leguminosarum]NEJ82547.1 pyridoxal-phosphate dependent enzyme [Rhizobium leguminosarum]
MATGYQTGSIPPKVEEIGNDTGGTVDIVISGIGTGGTITGVGQVLKSRKPEIKIIAVEPADPLWWQSRPAQDPGIGAGFAPKILDTGIYDEAFEQARPVARLEGVPVGISSGAALTAAIKVGVRPENAGKNIVIIIPSFAERYLSTAQRIQRLRHEFGKLVDRKACRWRADHQHGAAAS